MLLELKEAQMKDTGEYTNEICKVLGNQAKIKALTHETTVEIRDLDEITSEEDISNAIRTQVKELGDFDKGAIKSIKAAYAGTQTAVLSLSALQARALLEAKNIKIGWVICRIRERPKLKKCYRCLEYGHLARTCSNPDDRSQSCLKCGEKGHFAKTCDKKPSCDVCKKNGRGSTDHQIGSKKCPMYQAACKRAKT